MTTMRQPIAVEEILTRMNGYDGYDELTNGFLRRPNARGTDRTATMRKIDHSRRASKAV